MALIDRDRWGVLEPLLDHALELTDADREEWLRQLSTDSPDLASELTSLLAEDALAENAGFLTEPAAGALAGRTLGAWTLDRALGRGGMGNVWLARRTDGRFEGHAAVKLLNLALLTAPGRARFRREGSLLARLTHPGIARLLDAGVAPGGQPYLVLEHVAGERIDDYADAHGLGLTERIRLVLQVLEAVGHAHANLVVHRDLKPSNILVSADGRTKLLDFGIAKLLPAAAGGAAETGLTTFAPALTPEYAAPEQLRGGNITTATDVYAAGVLVYELLTGRRPFDLTNRSPAEAERLVCGTEPVRPSDTFAAASADGAERARARGATPERLRRQLKGDLDAIVLQALRKEPERRYGSAEALADDLRRFLEGRPVLARPEGALYRSRKFVGRHKGAVAVAGFASLLAMGAGVRERALRGRAEAEAAKARAVQAFLVRTFDVADPYGSERPAGDVTVRVAVDRAAARIDSVLARQPEVQSDLRLTLGHVYNSLGVYDRAVPLLQRSVAQLRQLHGPRDPTVAAALDELGQALAGQDKPDQAVPLLRSAVALRQAALGAGDTATATSLDHLATVYQQQSDYKKAEPLFRQALDIRRRVEGPEHVDVATSLNNLGVLYFLEAQYDRAAQNYQRALAISERRLGESHPLTLETLHNLAQVQDSRGHYAEAATLYERALAGKRRVLGDLHPSVTINLNNLGELLATRLGRVDEGIRLIREAIASDTRMFGPRHTFVAEGYTNLAIAMRRKGQIDSARVFALQALDIYRSVQPQNRVTLATGLNNAGLMTYMSGDFPSAIKYYREALELNRRLLGDKHPRVGGVELNLGRVLLESRRPADAEKLFRHAVAILDTTKTTQRRLSVGAQVGIGAALQDQGRAQEAEPVLEAALATARARFANELARGDAALALARCLLALGQRERAEPLIAEAERILEPHRGDQPRVALQLDAVRAQLRERPSALAQKGAVKQ